MPIIAAVADEERQLMCQPAQQTRDNPSNILFRLLFVRDVEPGDIQHRQE